MVFKNIVDIECVDWYVCVFFSHTPRVLNVSSDMVLSFRLSWISFASDTLHMTRLSVNEALSNHNATELLSHETHSVLSFYLTINIDK